MILSHLAPQQLCPLPSGTQGGVLIGLSTQQGQLCSACLQPASPARQQLFDWLQVHQDPQLERWFQAVDWLGQAPPDFTQRLSQWVRQQWAQRLAQHWNLPYLSAQQLRLGLPPQEDLWVCDQDQLLSDLARAWRPEKVTFWLDRPGFFSAQPHLIPQARQLRQLDSACAQELSRLLGLPLPADLLDTLANCDVPAEVGWLDHPDWACSRILPDAQEGSSILAVACSQQVDLVSFSSPLMWRRPGFLAQAFGALAQANLSVDLLATSQTSVTLTLDPGQRLEAQLARQLEGQLDCQVGVLSQCSCIHLVGHKIRQMLPQLGPALELFEEHPIHLVSQSSSDVSLSLVVHSEQAERLLTPLHALLFGGSQESETFGPTFQQLENRGHTTQTRFADRWWLLERDRLLALGEKGASYVYHAPSVAQRAQEVLGLGCISQALYALKANPHPQILAQLKGLGLGLECVSPGEFERAAEGRRLYTPNFVGPEEYQMAFAGGAWVTLDNVEALKLWPEVFAGREVLLRLDSGTGSGHHKHVRTAGDSSKFGISADQWPLLKALLREHQVGVLGLHSHAGSGITDAEHWVRTAAFLYAAAEEHFPQARVLNLGGGLGVPDRPGKARLDFARLQQSLSAFLELHPGRQLWLEPGRYLVAEAGVLLARVCQIKHKGEKRYLGLEVGMNTLIRPALYGAYHPIVNLTRWGQPAAWKVDVVGPICESGDVLGHDRWMPATEVGDLILIDNAGAYGASMASHYNLRKPAAEHYLE